MSGSTAPPLKVCEFYSGIGGYHIALSRIHALSYHVAAAFEISSNANSIYRANFPNTKVVETNLCGLTAARLDSILSKAGSVTSRGEMMTSRGEMTSPDEMVTSREEVMFVMSPPCQPFTRQGTKKDDLDPRSESVLHLFNIFPDLSSLPDYFLLENVQGFESSNTRKKIMQFFNRHSYHVAEFLINSNELGIPNSRLRYYLLARRRPFHENLQSVLTKNNDFLSSIPGLQNLPTSASPPLSKFLEADPVGYQLPDKFLGKWGWVLDIVTPSSTRSCCFTKGYSVKAEGSGSVLQLAPDLTDSSLLISDDKTDNERSICKSDHKTDNERSMCQSDDKTDNERSMCKSDLSDEEFLLHMKSLKLRFFTPREIARIHGIPDWYSFPEVLSERQMYKLLGNGLNVSVVKLLLEKVLLA